jgi:hypothetical protein
VGTNAALEGLGHLPDDERRLLAEVAAWPEHRCWAELTQPVLARLTAERGIDFATTLLYDRLRRSEQHGPFIRRVDEFITRPPLFAKKMDVLLAVAPGAYYRELPRAGGDGRLLREQADQFGCRSTVIPTLSMGSVADNGRIISAWLSERRHEKILLASVSKGAADIKAALARPEGRRHFPSR